MRVSPNHLLTDIRALVADVRQPELRFETGDTWENIAADLAGAIDALDKHLSDGGLLPVEWGLAGTSPTRG